MVWSERAVGAGEGTKQSCRVQSGAAPAWGAVPGISARVTEQASQMSAHQSCTGSAVFLSYHGAEAVPSSFGVYLDLKKAFNWVDKIYVFNFPSVFKIQVLVCVQACTFQFLLDPLHKRTRSGRERRSSAGVEKQRA